MGISIKHEFRGKAKDLWNIVGTPERIDWVPGVSDCLFDGEVRRLTMPGAGQIAERILLLDDKIMRIEYSCFESNPPLDHHIAIIQIDSINGSRCNMRWKTEVNPREVEPYIRQNMQACIERLQKLLETNQ